MITSRKAIAEFLKKSMITQHECNCQFWMSEKEEWDVKKQVDYINGVVLGKFRENDARKILKEGVTDEALITEIKIKLKREIKNIEKLKHPDILQKKVSMSFIKGSKMNYPCFRWMSGLVKTVD